MRLLCTRVIAALPQQPHALPAEVQRARRLQNEHDSELLEWYTTSQLVHVNVATGDSRPLGPPRMYVACDPSPDSSLMIVSWIERPFSFDLPAGRFPRVWQVWDPCDAAALCCHAWPALCADVARWLRNRRVPCRAMHRRARPASNHMRVLLTWVLLVPSGIDTGLGIIVTIGECRQHP